MRHLTLLLLAACSTAPGPNPDRIARSVTSAEGDIGVVVAGNNDMHWDVYGALAADSDDNLFLSTFSLSAALGMTFAGAAGTTRDEMADVLHVDLDDAAWHEAFGELVRDLQGDKDRGYTLRVANRLFGQPDFPWADAFLSVCSDAYDAPLQELDFAADPEAARGTINDWVAEQTADRIPDLLPAGSISGATRLVLANAIYFLADWAQQFDPDDTRPAPFTRLDGSTVQVDMMMLDTEAFDDFSLDVLLLDDVALVRLPYQDDEVSMILLLPTEVDGLPALEASLDAATVDGWIARMAPGQLTLRMPRLELRWEASLKDLLTALGMPTAFSAGADLSAMTDGPNGLFIDEVYHQAFVRIDEKGTEAAAATAVVVNETSAGTYLSADHPFLFLIRDDLTGSLLFTGRVLDPEAG